MDNLYQDSDIDFLSNHDLQNSTTNAGREFDDLFSRSSMTDNEPCASPSELSIKRHLQGPDPLQQRHVFSMDSPSDSLEENSSPGSSSESPRDHGRNSSVGSAAHSESAIKYQSDGWLGEMLSGKEDTLFSLDTDMHGLDHGFSMDTDIESSNRVMDSAFDFDSAASSPSPLKTEPSSAPKSQKSFKTQVRSPSTSAGHFTQPKVAGPIPPTGSPFHSNSSREASPMTSMLSPQGRSASAQWGGRSPASALEETFGGITMNGASPLNSSFSPSLSLGHNGMVAGSPEWPTEQTASVSDYAQSTSRINSSSRNHCRPILTVHPTSLKSRVETQIPIRLTLFPLPAGVKKLRLPSHTISKPKFLAKPDLERSPEMLELHTSLVCTSAMQDQAKLNKAFARARGETRRRRPSADAGAEEGSQDEEEKPLDGGEVKICSGCIQRERKRASRKKQRKPDEDELFQKDEEKRVIVFNTNQIKDWVEPPKNSPPGMSESTVSFVPRGAMQVELPMRIACYCRHQNEKLGFQVIFTIKDHLDNVVAQAITNSIMITDDHKTHAAPPPAPPPPSSALPDGTQLPGAGVFVSGPGHDASNTSTIGPQDFRVSQSSTDLQQQFPSQYPLTPTPYGIPQGSGASTSSFTPRNLSRQASPSDFPGPSSKRRKHSSSGKLPPGLTMTKLDGPQSSASGNASGNGPQFASGSRTFLSPADRPFVTPMAMSGQFGNGPPTPNSNDNNPYFNSVPPPQSLDNLAQQPLMSAHNSTHQSRPGTPPGSSRNNFPDPNQSLTLGPNPTNHIWPPLSNPGNRLPSIIHKLVPAEGSTTGGTEVTLLGSGFYPGMEVVFGDTLATTTTFWGDKCLNCLTPPALQPGLVPVVFKHEHPTFGQMQHQSQPIIPKQQHYFRYVDDRELQMYRLALGILGQKLRNPTDAFQTAQRIMGGDPSTLWAVQNDLQGGNGGQRQVPGLNAQGQTSDLDSKMLTYLEFIDLDESPRAPKYNMRSSAGQTLLHFASSLGLTRFVAGLLARGANPDVQDNNGHTPMHLAALSGHAHIVHRLRLAGANASARSIRGFTPADLATSLPAHQAALIPAHHYRSRSVGSSPSLRRRPSSSASLSSFWETSSASGSLNYAVDDDSDDSEQSDSEANSRRSSMHQDTTPSLYYTQSREGSVQLESVHTPAEASTEEEDSSSFSPPAALVAWRNHLATQIHQFQQSVGRAFPNLPALPPMPALPDYQAYPMMRRISNLVPHRPGSSWSAKEGWWDLLTGSSAAANSEPPAYEELYPHKETDEDHEVKKASLVAAAADAALDEHFEAKASSSRQTVVQEEIKDIRIGRKSISREQQEQLRQQQARKMKGLGSDRNLYFFWIPVLLLVLCAWLKNLVPGLWKGISEGYEFMKARYTNQAIEVGM
ncbi:hypothetical protein VTN77DRAFT_9540 [Rasamsonia byssochlamydoides]|uniref:uncharacterized protein n=1 Tax=Rasamsonia byssochlamydoides TaxID=89139 RepID=UPI003744404A